MQYKNNHSHVIHRDSRGIQQCVTTRHVEREHNVRRAEQQEIRRIQQCLMSFEVLVSWRSSSGLDKIMA